MITRRLAVPGSAAAFADQPDASVGRHGGSNEGVYLNSMIPEVPEFDDGETQLQWKFRPSRAQGTVDNEIAVAFG